MKKLLSGIVAFCCSSVGIAQNVGIGITTPQARLHVMDSNVVFTGPSVVPGTTTFNPPVQGAGSRMMWYPQKAAFRAGVVNETQWNKDSIGRYSFATGNNTKARGEGGFATGNQTSAAGFSSTATGEFTNASGFISTAMGAQTKATDDFATATGFATTAAGNSSTAMGQRTIASGYAATALGSESIASGTASTAMGYGSIAGGNYSLAAGFSSHAVADFSSTIGFYTKAKSANSFVIGIYNDTSMTNRIFEIGNGISNNNRKNAMTVIANGNAGIGTVTPLARLHVADSNVVFTGPTVVPAATTFNPPVQGAGTRMMWYPQKAAFRAGTVNGTQWNKDSIGRFSFATGNNTKAKGESGFATGNQTSASGFSSTATGEFTNASGFISTAMGAQTKATDDFATATGFSTTASGKVSTATGLQTIASGQTSTAMGSGSVASGSISTALGNFSEARGSASTAIGYGSIAEGNWSLAAGFRSYAGADHSSTIGFYTKAKSANSFVVGAYNDTSGTNRVFEIGNGTADNDRKNAMTVLSNGNIGFGLSSPNAPLQFANSIVNRKMVLYDVNNNDHQYYGFGINGGTLRYQVDAVAASHAFFAAASPTGSNELFRIKGNGDIGVGVSNPSAFGHGGNNRIMEIFNFNIGSNIQSHLILSTNGTSGSAGGLTWASNNTFLPEKRLAFIGTIFETANSTKLTFYTRRESGTLSEAFYIQGNGNAVLSGILSQLSDSRLKKNIRPLVNSLQNVEKLGGYTYNWIDETKDNDEQVGLLAQDVQKIYPQLVKEDSNGTLSVNYSGMVPVLLEAIKEQQVQRNKDDQRITQLEKQVQELLVLLKK